MGRLLDKLAGLTGKGKLKLLAITVAAAILLGVLLGSIVQIASTVSERNAAQAEYDGLQEQFSPRAQSPNGNGMGVGSADASEFPRDPIEINPDYVGWLAVPGASVDHPVVRGSNNTRYLTTTFEGNYNGGGAIFMDCGNTVGFASAHTILYGHNVKNGSMFGRLKLYLNAQFLAENSTVTVTLLDGTTQTWKIFAARTTDAWDAAYRLDFVDDAEFVVFAAGLGAPEGTTQILTFSTCTNSEDDNERLLVHATLVR